MRTYKGYTVLLDVDNHLILKVKDTNIGYVEVECKNGNINVNEVDTQLGIIYGLEEWYFDVSRTIDICLELYEEQN